MNHSVSIIIRESINSSFSALLERCKNIMFMLSVFIIVPLDRKATNVFVDVFEPSAPGISVLSLQQRFFT